MKYPTLPGGAPRKKNRGMTETTGVTPGSAVIARNGSANAPGRRRASVRDTVTPPGAARVLPMQLQVDDRLTDETGEYEVIGRPFTTAAGKTANVRVKRIDSDVQMIRVYGAQGKR